MVDDFIQAIRNKTNIRIVFFSKEDGHNLTRRCSPMDYGPSKRAVDRSDRFHVWDFDSDTKPHTLSLRRDQVVSIEILDDIFDPADFVTWSPTNWIVERDWGDYS